MRFPTTPLDADRAIKLTGRVNGAAVIRLKGTEMKILIVAVLILFCAGGNCLSEPPPAQDHNNPKTAQYQATTVHNNPNPSPITNVATSSLEKKPEQNKPHWYDELDKNRFLLLIGLLQLVVFGWQGVCLRQTVKVTKKAADAAEKSAAALPLIERAHVFAEIALDGVGFNFPKTFNFYKDSGDLGTCSVIAHFKNHGKTPAVLTKLHLLIDKVPAYTYPTEITEIIKNEIPPGIVISSEG